MEKINSRKKNIRLTFSLFALVGIIALQNCSSTPKSVIAEAKEIKKHWANEPIVPIPIENNLDARKVSLGQKLFHEKLLSHDNSISCAGCHDLNKGGTDNAVNSVGINGQVGAINSPTVLNACYNFKQFWDGRAESLEEQVDGPTHAGKEMGSNWPEIIGKLSAVAEYQASFAALYKDGVQSKNIKDAIATFERSLSTPNSRFDQFLNGKKEALTQEEIDGYQLFKNYGCISCHQGVNIGGNLFQKFGVMGNYFEDRGHITAADFGRYNVTKNAGDKFVFKVPSLRNIALTAPYFHDGSAQTLDQAVQVMGRYQLGRVLTDKEVSQIVKFLNTLTGEQKR